MSLDFGKTAGRHGGNRAGAGIADPVSARRLRRAARIGGALALLGVGAYAILSERGYVASENAVAMAYVISLHAPIEGYVSGIRGGMEDRGGSLDFADGLALPFNAVRPVGDDLVVRFPNEPAVRRALIVKLFTGDYDKEVEKVHFFRAIRRVLASILST
jgi:hypothetical protein